MIRASSLFSFALSVCSFGNPIPSGFSHRPLAFEPNRGQAAGPVRFVARGSSYDFWLNGSGLTVLGASLHFSGANLNPQAAALDPLTERHNYFRSASSQIGIPTYRRVRYSGLYPGIDCVFYGDRKGLEFDFEVSRGAEPDKIRLRWTNANLVRLDANGELVIETALGELRQRKPNVYQEHRGQRILIDGSYVLAPDGGIRFSLGRYDRTRPVIIDPVLFAMNTGVAPVTAMASDSARNIYLTGTTATSVLPTTAGAVQPAFGGGTCFGFPPPSTFPCSDAFVIKLDPRGELIYATYLGGHGSDGGNAIAVDASGNVYVGGSTNSNSGASSFPTTPEAAFPKPTSTGNDGFVTKLNPEGNQLLYSTFVPNAPTASIALDPQGNVYLSSNVNPHDSPFPVTAGAFQASTSTLSTTGLVAELNAAGSALVYASYLGGTGGDYATSIAVDSLGALYVAGLTNSTDFPTTPGAFRTKLSSPNAGFVTKIAPNGASLVYSTYLGETGPGAPVSAIRVDSLGNAAVLGTGSADFPITAGAFQPVGPKAPWITDQNVGAILLKLNASGSALVYSTFISGGKALDMDGEGNAYVLGEASYGFPTTAGALQPCSHGGSSDIFAAEFDPKGKLSAATYLGGSGTEIANAIVALGAGSIYMAGNTDSFDFPGIVGASNLNFVAKMLIDDPNHPSGPCLAYALQNGATFIEGPIVAGEIVTLRGTGIGPQTAAFGKKAPDGNTPTELAGVQVFFDDIPAPLLFVQSQQVNAVVPWGIAFTPVVHESTQVRLEYNGGSSIVSHILMSEAAPGIFVSDYSTLQAAALNADGTPNLPTNPAKRGSVVALFGTGGGVMDPPGVTGRFWSQKPLSHITQPVAVQINKVDAEVVYAGSAPGMLSGIFQINVRLPDSVSGPGNPIQVTVGGVSSPQGAAYLAVE